MYYIFLAHGFEELEAITVIDMLRRAKIDVRTVSINDKIKVTGAHNITINTDLLIKDLSSKNIDGIILPGGMPGSTNLKNDSTLTKLIFENFHRGKLIAAICAAPIVLAKANILQDIQATCYPSFENQLTGAIISDEKVIIDKNVITSKGPGTAINFGFELIKYISDDLNAKSVINGMLVNI